jgi:4-amino-4-deoxy-L-arabinose transferase-like glycosyltransferase
LETARHRRLFWLLLAGTGVLTLFQLGHLPLTDVDEPVYGEVGKEMAHSGPAGWLSPHFNGALWFDKPPLFYWLTALSMRVFGVSEWTARLPSALLGIGLVWATYSLARRAYPRSPEVGLWAGFVLATTAQFFLLAHAAVTDMTLAFTLLMALLGVYAWVTTGRGRWMALAGAMTGLATLTKGPVAIVLIGLQVIVFLALARQGRRLLSPALWAGFALCLAIALPWFLAMIHLHGGLFIQGFLEANNVTRFLKAEHPKTQQFLYYVPVFCGFFLPWTLALPGAVATAWGGLRTERQDPDGTKPTLFLVLWFVLVFVFFSASQTKLVTYIFPVFPIAAIVTGSGIAQRVWAKTYDRAAWAFGIFFALVTIGAAIAGRKFAIAPLTVTLWMIVLLSSALQAVWALSPVRRWIVPGLALSLFLLIAWASPTWRTRAADVSDRDAAQTAARNIPAGGTLYTLGMKHPSLIYYSDRHVIQSDDRAEGLRDMRAHPDHTYALGPHVLDDLRDHHGFRDYRVLFAKPRLTVIQAMPKDQKTDHP